MDEMLDPFAPPDVQWHGVSDRLAVGRRVSAGAAFVGLLLLIVLPALFLPFFWLAAAGPVLAYAWVWWLAGRQVRATGYAERAEDLLVRSGVMFRQITVVPYGRLQFVDIQAGPLARRLGYCTLQLHTASPKSDAVIRGLVPQEAARLRDQLAQRGEARLAGL